MVDIAGGWCNSQDLDSLEINWNVRWQASFHTGNPNWKYSTITFVPENHIFMERSSWPTIMSRLVVFDSRKEYLLTGRYKTPSRWNSS